MARGRRPGFVMSDEHRTKIANSQILKRLIEHVEGKVEMGATQITAGLGLLRKVMPDLAATEHSGALTLTHEDALGELDDQGEANPPQAEEQSTALRSEVSQDQDKGGDDQSAGS